MSAPATCSTPDRGYMGDPARGASLGRASRDRESAMARLRADIAEAERRLECWSDPSSAYLFAPANPGAYTRDEALARCQADLETDRAELARLEAGAAAPPRFHLRRVLLDSGGYDPGGAYWGHGGELFEAYTADGAEFMTLRIYPADRSAAFERHGGRRVGEPGFRRCDWSRIAARDVVREEYPDARFYR